jgi:hypothetical protein
VVRKERGEAQGKEGEEEDGCRHENDVVPDTCVGDEVKGVEDEVKWV